MNKQLKTMMTSDEKLREDLIEASRPILALLKNQYKKTGCVHAVKIVDYTVTQRIELTQQLGDEQILVIDIEE